jgi:CheY-like chemotaxis protein
MTPIRSVVRYTGVGDEVVTVLCVDDDPLLRRALQRQIHGLGYRVVTVAGAAEACDVLESRAVDIVVSDLDLGVPDEGGRELLAHVAVFWPATGRVLMSGSFADGGVGGEFPLAHACLRKPIDPDALRDALARARADARGPVR